MHDFTNGEFAENMSRVANLITASEKLLEQEPGIHESASDVLRAAVVFLHSSLEEIIRNLYLYRLPNLGTESLNRIPFAAHEPSHRPKNIQLGELLDYRGQLVENLIHASINQYVNALNINNTGQLVDCLKLAKIPCDSLQPFFSKLESLMKRRHQVVHQMDRTNELDPLASPINSIGVEMVEEWSVALTGFADALFSLVPAPNSGT